jgi:hypothetical protein
LEVEISTPDCKSKKIGNKIKKLMNTTVNFASNTLFKLATSNIRKQATKILRK